MFFEIFQLKIKIKLIFERNGPAADADHNIYLESPNRVGSIVIKIPLSNPSRYHLSIQCLT